LSYTRIADLEKNSAEFRRANFYAFKKHKNKVSLGLVLTGNSRRCYHHLLSA